MNFWKRYPGDYAKKTAHLSLAEHGAYALLLDAYYSAGGSLENKMQVVYRICRATTPKDRLICESVLKQFFVLEFGRLFNRRADEEIEKYLPSLEAARVNGTRGGRPKKNPLGSENKPAGFLAEKLEPPFSKSSSDTRDTSTALPGSVAAVLPSLDSESTPKTVLNGKRKKSVSEKKPAPTAATWLAYGDAYRKRYGGADPVRNITTNSQMANFVRRIGVEESPAVSAFYVSHNAAFYYAQGHSVAMLLKDAEKLRTEWFTGRKVHATEARMKDQTASNPFVRMLETHDAATK